jgi:alpha-beta hydrolase superfamily lysophospholipase
MDPTLAAVLTTPDGLSLHLHAWPRPAGPARGTVLIVHGLGEHGGRYTHVAAHLAAHGWAVIGYDQRGHGRSGGPRGGLPADDSLLVDLGRVIDHARARSAGAGASPLVVLGHSMGGLVVARYGAEALASTFATAPAPWWQPVDALVLSSPALDPGMSAAQKLLLAVAAPLAPNLALGNGLDPAWVCSDPAVVRAYIADPLTHDRITPRLARFIVDGGVRVRGLAARWATPTLLLYAGADRCVAPGGSDAFVAAAPAAVVQSHRYDGFSHEIFNEPGQAAVLADLTTWLAARFGAAA